MRRLFQIIAFFLPFPQRWREGARRGDEGFLSSYSVPSTSRWLRCFYYMLLIFISASVFADTPISFAPPLTDYSVGFLANIFGIVDGVLHGTGSQIMGAIFEVFNAAVMALGGMIITYTMLISTMNTAHEGEMLGKKWNSIWVPVRATAGFALLIPKASGYCLLQIFVMWVVVQGVGAADKVWDAALNYLNRGGVIIQAQQDPTKALLGQTGANDAMKGAMVILSGQVCMLAVQQVLENALADYTAEGSSVCSSHPMPSGGGTPSNLERFCSQSTVPNFTDSVDIIGATRTSLEQLISGWSAYASEYLQNPQTTTPLPVSPSNPSMPMPNFDPNQQPLYAQFNGMCGTIKWNWMDTSSIIVLLESGLNLSDIKSAMQARNVAIAQMYSDLQPTAQSIVTNDTLITPSSTTPSAQVDTSSANLPSANAGANENTQQPTPTTAKVPFGVPLTSDDQVCVNSGDPNCTGWGAPGFGGGSVLLSGTELKSAVLDYYGVMKPTLTLLALGKNNKVDNSAKDFIQTAKSSGWLMAGSYFFNLIALNNAHLGASGVVDSDSGLAASTFDLSNLTSSFPSAGNTMNQCIGGVQGSFPVFCELLQFNVQQPNNIISLFNGGYTQATSPPMDVLKYTPISAVPNASKGIVSSSIFGYLQNALVIQLPGQQGQNTMGFDKSMTVNFESQSFGLPKASFACGGISFIFFHICIGEILGNIIYNAIMVNVMNFFAGFLLTLVQEMIMAIVTIPLQGFAAIFKGAVAILAVPGINPVIALANMGTYYINFVGGLWLTLLIPTAIASSVSIIGVLLALPFAMGMIVVTAWSGIMLGVGFITAYYVPIVPYMIFTFGTIAWFIAVVEAMVAAPIVALGIVHPEGHDAFGKGEAAIMILMNVFLRPAMMIIGYISAISLSYVGVWILNAGFDNAIGFIQGGKEFGTFAQSSSGGFSGLGAAAHVGYNDNAEAAKQTAEDLGQGFSSGAQGIGRGLEGVGEGLQAGTDANLSQAGGPDLYAAEKSVQDADQHFDQARSDFSKSGSAFSKAGSGLKNMFHQSPISTPGAGDIKGGYVGWAGIFAYFFSILIYTTIYMQIVEQAFTLISVLPDKVLRWIGGQAGSEGAEAARGAEKIQGKIEKAGDESGKAMVAAGEKAGGALAGKIAKKPGKGDAKMGGGGEGGAPPASPSAPPPA